MKNALSRKKALSREERDAVVLKLQANFVTAETIEEAWEHVNGATAYHDMYQHYTSLSSAFCKLLKGEWWFSRSDSTRLNDLQEHNKFGDLKIAARSYQTSFSYGRAESANMWGLYCNRDDSACRITIAGEVVEEWANGLRGCRCGLLTDSFRKRDRQIVKSRTWELCDFRDLIYAAVSNSNDSADRFDKHRSNTLSWFEQKSKAPIDGIRLQTANPKITGWFKDSEWQGEHESRIVLRIRDMPIVYPEAIAIRIPIKVRKAMRITLSPWLSKDKEDEVIKQVAHVLSVVHPREDVKKFIKRSVLTGALNFK